MAPAVVTALTLSSTLGNSRASLHAPKSVATTQKAPHIGDGTLPSLRSQRHIGASYQRHTPKANGTVHRQRVGPLAIAEGADRDVVDADRQIDGHPGVVGLAAVVVPGAGNVVPGRTEDPAQIRVPQGAAAGCLALQVDLVGGADGGLQFEPVDVTREIDLASLLILLIPDRHSPGRAAVGRVLVGILRDVDDRQLVAARLERLAARRDVIGATDMGVKRHTEQVVGA